MAPSEDEVARYVHFRRTTCATRISWRNVTVRVPVPLPPPPASPAWLVGHVVSNGRITNRAELSVTVSSTPPYLSSLSVVGTNPYNYVQATRGFLGTATELYQVTGIQVLKISIGSENRCHQTGGPDNEYSQSDVEKM